MNEALKNLFFQAVGGSSTLRDNEEVTLTGADLESFAKSIMSECAWACSSSYCGRTKSASDLISERFGINIYE